MKKLLKVVLITALVLCALGFGAGWYMCSFSLLPEVNSLDKARGEADVISPGASSWFDSLHEAGVFKDMTIVGEGGYRLHAVYASAKDPSNAQGTAVVVHGYTNNHITFMGITRMYRDSLNYNVLVPDLHFHGLSEGRSAQMGWLDRLDVEKFAILAHDIFKDDFMVMHGVSMGAATVMMMSGDRLPQFIRAYVEDCGYSSAWDEFAYMLKGSFNLPTFPLLDCASIVCRLRYGWSFKQASSVKQLDKCDRPMLFIHGDKDSFVPTEHVYKNYEAKTKGYKELWVTEGTEHSMSLKDYPEEYQSKVSAFLQKAKSL